MEEIADYGADETKEMLPQKVPEQEKNGRPQGFLELVYGVLFEPSATFSRIKDRERLPVGRTVIIFTLANVAVSLMSATVTSRLMYFHAVDGAGVLMRSVAPAMAVLGLFFQYAKWFFYSGLLHLLAEFFGGRGRALGVFVVSGLASLPAVFTVPVNFLLLLFGVRGFTLSFFVYLFSVVAVVWGAVLLVLGIREVHGLSTGRAVAVVLLPLGAALAAAVLLAGVLAACAAVFLPFLNVPKIGP
ncbi:MAG: YIP1 family protein [Armatimonadetes bacterium]|nr:YIP1 family protein [Armatimonadota bacterium]